MDLIVGRIARCSSLLSRNSSSFFMPIEFNTFARHLYCINTKTQKYDVLGKYNNNRLCHITFLNNLNKHVKIHRTNHICDQRIATYSDQAQDNTVKKLSMLQRMKQLMKDYWYIVVPVHVVTSIGWGALFYLSSKNGINFADLLENAHVSEYYVDMLRNSNAGHWVIAYTMYKICTPVRYTVTLGGTSMAIRYLNRLGYLKLKDSKQAMQSKNFVAEARYTAKENKQRIQ